MGPPERIVDPEDVEPLRLIEGLVDCVVVDAPAISILRNARERVAKRVIYIANVSAGGCFKEKKM
jgi:hypothetical protein